ncbi:MAG: hypothetical protein Q4F84_02410 [Fibrobacter sp.]|nr:hypothetical protein [Fibrobacter sp.]
MDGISAVSGSIDTVNQIMKNMNKEAIDYSKKLLEVNVNMALGAETGKGALINMVA